MTDDDEIWAKEPDLAALTRAHGLLRVDPKSALNELERLAEQGSIMSMVYIGSAYRDGTGVMRDVSQAER
jgi:TPR repeat protein